MDSTIKNISIKIEYSNGTVQYVKLPEDRLVLGEIPRSMSTIVDTNTIKKIMDWFALNYSYEDILAFVITFTQKCKMHFHIIFLINHFNLSKSKK